MDFGCFWWILGGSGKFWVDVGWISVVSGFWWISVDSGGFRLVLEHSAVLWWIAADSGGLCWILLDFG